MKINWSFPSRERRKSRVRGWWSAKVMGARGDAPGAEQAHAARARGGRGAQRRHRPRWLVRRHAWIRCHCRLHAGSDRPRSLPWRVTALLWREGPLHHRASTLSCPDGRNGPLHGHWLQKPEIGNSWWLTSAPALWKEVPSGSCHLGLRTAACVVRVLSDVE